jgi:D-alanyl-D-alanine carboxypeptidase/D-alanyl-D-alanine-endopeptidase (penicillin-binding protein 4)
MNPLAALAALLACAALTLPAAATELPPEFAAAIKAAGLPLEAVGVSARRLSDNAEVVSHQADRPMAPASTMKLVTTIVGLERLGPAWRGRTELRTRGTMRDGVLTGDIYLRGIADVDLDWLAFERMLKRLRLQGIREIHGDLVLDRALFNPARSDVGVAAFDESPEFRYNVIPDALLLNTNLVEIDLASPGEAVEVAAWTPLERVSFTSEMKLVDRACESWEDGWLLPAVSRDRTGRVHVKLKGDFPRDCLASTAINVIDRVTFADRLFRALWTRLGGKFKGSVREGEMPPEARLLAEHRSRTLTDVARDVNKRSDNPIARMVFLALGTLGPTLPQETTFQRADREVRLWMERRGIDTAGLVLENGSGLSRLERIKPAQLTAVLRAAMASEWAPEFVSSLPIVGVDGTMRRRLHGTAAAERARVKTGTLRDVSAVAGYVKDGAGDTLVVTAIFHHPAATRQVARPLLDVLLESLARSTSRVASPSGS